MCLGAFELHNGARLLHDWLQSCLEVIFRWIWDPLGVPLGIQGCQLGVCLGRQEVPFWQLPHRSRTHHLFGLFFGGLGVRTYVFSSIGVSKIEGLSNWQPCRYFDDLGAYFGDIWSYLEASGRSRRPSCHLLYRVGSGVVFQGTSGMSQENKKG